MVETESLNVVNVEPFIKSDNVPLVTSTSKQEWAANFVRWNILGVSMEVESKILSLVEKNLAS